PRVDSVPLPLPRSIFFLLFSSLRPREKGELWALQPGDPRKNRMSVLDISRRNGLVQPRHCKVTYGTDRRAEEEVETVELERWGEKTELGSD
ncbi:hypothetical protein KUCAC02_005299, partial [Chaenocephalus aceratus]